MDKFITRTTEKTERAEIKPIRRKDPNIPMELWPLADQIAYWDNLGQSDWFDRMFPAYTLWLASVKDYSEMYPITFTDVTSPHKSRLRELYEGKVRPKTAVRMLRNEGIIH